MNECFIRAPRVAIAQHLQEVTITYVQFSPALKFTLFGNVNLETSILEISVLEIEGLETYSLEWPFLATVVRL